MSTPNLQSSGSSFTTSVLYFTQFFSGESGFWLYASPSTSAPIFSGKSSQINILSSTVGNLLASGGDIFLSGTNVSVPVLSLTQTSGISGVFVARNLTPGIAYSYFVSGLSGFSPVFPTQSNTLTVTTNQPTFGFDNSPRTGSIILQTANLATTGTTPIPTGAIIFVNTF